MRTTLNMRPPWGLVDLRFHEAVAARGDTAEHLPLLRDLAERANGRVVEFGVRNVVSTWALLAGRPRELVSVDIVAPPAALVDEATRAANAAGVPWSFVLGDTRTISRVACEFLFIDTLHTNTQLRAELTRHAPGVTRWIAMHDTETFGEVGEDESAPGLRAAISRFLSLEAGRSWRIVHDVAHCNGLVVLERVR